MHATGKQSRLAETPAEREAIYGFRYEAAVQEQGPRPPGADHDRRQITDEHDDGSLLLYISRGERIAATLRLCFGNDSLPEAWFDWCGLDPFERFGRESWCFCSQFLVAPEFQGTTIAETLYVEAFELSVQLGARFHFSLSPPHRLGMYSQLGFRRYKSNLVLDTVGFRIPLVLLTEDAEYLEWVRSPVAKLARDLARPNETSRWFSETFPSELGLYNERAEQRRYLVDLHKLGLFEQARLFAGLDCETMEELVSGANVVCCQPGDRILRRGDAGEEIFVIVDGDATRGGGSTGPTQLLGPGDFFGEIAFATQSLRNDEVHAISPLTVLVFTRPQMLQLMRKTPEAAASIHANIARQMAYRLRQGCDSDAASSPEAVYATPAQPAAIL